MGKYDKKPASGGGSAPQAPRFPFGKGQSAPASGGRRSTAGIQTNPELARIAQWLAAVRFKRKTFGGLDPQDVWKKIEELNALYEDALVAERARYDLLLRMSRRNAPAESPGGEGPSNGETQT